MGGELEKFSGAYGNGWTAADGKRHLSDVQSEAVPGALVIALGTNDAKPASFRFGPRDQTKGDGFTSTDMQNFRDLVREAKSPCKVLVLPGYGTALANAQGGKDYAAQIDRARIYLTNLADSLNAASTKKNVIVVDGKPRVTGPDGIHFDQSQANARRDLYRKAVTRCP